MSKLYQDPILLGALYHGQNMSQRQVAEELGCCRHTVINWMEKHEIKSREQTGPDRNEPYKDEETLRRLYHEEGLTTYEIAEKFDVIGATIAQWLNKLDIEHPGPDEAKRTVGCHYRTRKSQGYTHASAGTSEYTDSIPIHRLLAVAEYGYDAVKEKVVHHKNHLRWDNRPDNIELLTAEEHGSHHAPEIQFWKESELWRKGQS